MKYDDEKNYRYQVYKGMGFFLGILALCIITGIVSADTYTASDQNANGQYQIVYTINSDNSQTFKAAGVAYGTMMVTDPPSSGQTATQDVWMSGQYGYALDASQDSSGNQADTETWLYGGTACIHQAAGVVQPVDAGSSQVQAGTSFVPFTGAWAAQCVYSTNASAIIADTDSQSTDGLTADVNAQATGITNALAASPSSRSYGTIGWSMFGVSQWAGAFTPVTTHTESFSSVSRNFGSSAMATQFGGITDAGTATASTSSSTPNGLSTLVSASVTGGGLPTTTGSFSNPIPFANSYLNFCMHSSAENGSAIRGGYGFNDEGQQYTAKSEAEICATGVSGSTSSGSGGPNGQFATVDANFVRNSFENTGIYGDGAPGNIDIDLSALAKLNSEVTVTKVDNKLNFGGFHSIGADGVGYRGNVTALNSADIDNYDHSTFNGNLPAGGVSGVVTNTSTGEVYDSWAHTWPKI